VTSGQSAAVEVPDSADVVVIGKWLLRSIYKILCRKSEETRQLEDLGTQWRIILEWILEK